MCLQCKWSKEWNVCGSAPNRQPHYLAASWSWSTVEETAVGRDRASRRNYNIFTFGITKWIYLHSCFWMCLQQKNPSSRAVILSLNRAELYLTSWTYLRKKSIQPGTRWKEMYRLVCVETFVVLILSWWSLDWISVKVARLWWNGKYAYKRRHIKKLSS